MCQRRENKEVMSSGYRQMAKPRKSLYFFLSDWSLMHVIDDQVFSLRTQHNISNRLNCPATIGSMFFFCKTIFAGDRLNLLDILTTMSCKLKLKVKLRPTSYRSLHFYCENQGKSWGGENDPNSWIQPFPCFQTFGWWARVFSVFFFLFFLDLSNGSDHPHTYSNCRTDNLVLHRFFIGD